MATLLSYSNQPGEGEVAIPELLPPDFEMGVNGQGTVVHFYHSHCLCTGATTRCLERLAASFATKTQIIVYAFLPHRETKDWIESATTEKLRSLGDVTVIADRNTEAARRSSVPALVHSLVYGPRAELRFSGGFTPSLRQEVRCTSGTAFLNAVNGESTAMQMCPAFGYPIVCDGGETQT